MKKTPYFLIFVLTLSLVLVYFLVKPFLGPLILAIVFAFIFQKIYKYFVVLFNDRQNLASFVTTLIAIVLIIVPITFIGSQIFFESSNLYRSLTNGDKVGFVSLIESSVDKLSDSFPILKDFNLDFASFARQGIEVLIQNFGKIFSSFAKILLNSFVFLVSFFFFLKDGNKLKNYLVELSPLEDKNDELIVSRLKLAVAATVRGNLLIGVVQGTLTGLGLLIFGVPNAVLWGCVAAIAALIPGVGTALVLAPAIIFLFISGSTFGAVGLIMWGVVAVGMIDNILGPRLVGKGMHLHPLAVFLAVLGGLSFFGPLGFLLGPLTVSLCLALVDIYFSLKR